jgi:hypothetical protein
MAWLEKQVSHYFKSSLEGAQFAEFQSCNVQSFERISI